MTFLDRLKKVFTGEEEPEKKKKQGEAAKAEEPQKGAKTETEKKPPVEENEVAAEKGAASNTDEVKKESVKGEAEIPSKGTAEEMGSEKSKEPETLEPETGKEEQVKTETTEKTENKPKKERSESMTLLKEEENPITRADIDPDFKQDIMDAGAESVALCFQCGTCTGACPSGRRTPYRVRQLVRRAVLGLKDDVISDDTIWMCTTCYECQERCPRAIKIVDVVKIVRNYAAQAGYMGQAHKMVGSFVIKTGHGVPINPQTKELRKKVGLDELPPTTHTFPEALDEVQGIVKATGFDSLIGYNWETGEIE